MSKTKKMEETHDQQDQTVTVMGVGTPWLKPLTVVQTFVAAIKGDSDRQELAENYILSSFKRTFVPLMSGKNVLAHFPHEGFKEAALSRISDPWHSDLTETSDSEFPDSSDSAEIPLATARNRYFRQRR